MIDEEDILAALKEHGQSIALVMIGGVHYYSGQAFDLERITVAAHEKVSVASADDRRPYSHI